MKARFLLLCACLAVIAANLCSNAAAETPLVLPRVPQPEDPYIPKPATDEEYKNALVASLHHLAADRWDSEHLAAMLDRNPKLVNERVTFKQPRKPLTTDHYAAIHYAASAGNLEGVKVLIAYKADVNLTAGLDWTPLHFAASGGHLNLCKVLIAAGAKHDAKTATLPERAAPSGPPNAPPLMLPPIPAYTPLDLAKKGKHKDVVEYLSSLK